MTDSIKKRKDQRKFAEPKEKDIADDAQALDQFTVLQDTPEADLGAKHASQNQQASPSEDVASSGNLNYRLVERDAASGLDLTGDGIENPGLQSLAGSRGYSAQSTSLEAVAGNNFDTIISAQDEALASAFGDGDNMAEQNWYDILDADPLFQPESHSGKAHPKGTKHAAGTWDDLLDSGSEDLSSGGDILLSDSDIGTDGGFG